MAPRTMTRARGFKYAFISSLMPNITGNRWRTLVSLKIGLALYHYIKRRGIKAIRSSALVRGCCDGDRVNLKTLSILLSSTKQFQKANCPARPSETTTLHKPPRRAMSERILHWRRLESIGAMRPDTIAPTERQRRYRRLERNNSTKVKAGS